MSAKSSPVLLLFLAAVLVAALPGPATPAQSMAALPAAALEASLMKRSGGHARVVSRPDGGRVSLIGFDRAAPLEMDVPSGSNPGQTGLAFLAAYGGLFGLRDAAGKLAVVSVKPAAGGSYTARYQQVYQGVPVLAGELVMRMDSDGGVFSVAGEILPDFQLDIVPDISAAQAREMALAAEGTFYQGDASSFRAGPPELWIYAPSLLDASGDQSARLVWRVEVGSTMRDDLRDLILLDARNGVLVARFDRVEGLLNRLIYDNDNDPNAGLPGIGPVREEGDLPANVNDADNAYEFIGAADGYFRSQFNRDSIDGKGGSVTATVRYCAPDVYCPFLGSFWNGEQMVFGADFSDADDVVAHEFTHGVIQYEAHLFNYYQSGAIAEAYADLFGELVDFAYSGVNDDTASRWWIGESLPPGLAYSLADPTKTSRPDKMSSKYYQTGPVDNGGVHKNAGVGEKAAYLMANDDYALNFFNGYTLRGIGLEKTGRIWYEALTGLLTSGADYYDLYQGLYQACLNLENSQGITRDDCEQVRLATLAVEMDQPAPLSAPEAPLCPIGAPGYQVFQANFETGDPGWELVPLSGPLSWTLHDDGIYVHSGTGYLKAVSDGTVIGSATATTPVITVPPHAGLHFAQAFDFSGAPCNGGLFEYSLDGGLNWIDGSGLKWINGYNGNLDSGCSVSEAGYLAFKGASRGYITSRVDLRTLAGKNASFRWRLISGSAGSGSLWYLDDVTLLECDIEEVYLPLLAR